MSDLPRDPANPGGDHDLEPLELELDEDGNPVEPDPELDEDGNPIELEPDPDAEPEPQRTRARGPRGRPNGEVIRELSTRLEETQRQLADLQRRPPAQPAFDPQAAAAAEAKFWADLELMAPADAMRAVYSRATREVQQQLGYQQATTQEAIDKQAYDANARSSQTHQRYRQRVEDMVAAERARGNIVNREVALKYLLGEDALARGNRVGPGQRRAGAARVASQTTRPTNGRGDVARGGGRRDQGADDEALLRGITAGDI